jgi:site-specific DNA-methyltransferase (cytosine-N4-specific)
MTNNARPTRGKMLLPLLETLRDAGGSAKPRDIYDEVAHRLGLDPAERTKVITYGDKQGNLFERDIRWLRQSAKQKGLIAGEDRGKWALTDEGSGKLLNAKPGILITIFETGLGTALWGHAETTIGTIADNSLDLIFSSPPFPNAYKEYKDGHTLDEQSWVDFMFDLITSLEPKMTATGSQIWDIAETFRPGIPAKAEYLSRLRVRLADESRFKVLDTLIWDNTSKLPNFEFVASRRIRLKQSADTLLWISPEPDRAKADNRNVLRPYGKTMLEHLDGSNPYPDTESRHASGHHFSRNKFAHDNGGSIPGQVLQFGASGGNRLYYKGVKIEQTITHPAIMPIKVAEFCIKLTTDPMDMVYDPLGGTLTTAAAAERLGRRWITNECSLAYLAAARHRFPRRHDQPCPI